MTTSTPCPFHDAYHFIYSNNSGGFCRNPVSYVRPCSPSSRLVFHFRRCSDAAYTHDRGSPQRPCFAFSHLRSEDPLRHEFFQFKSVACSQYFFKIYFRPVLSAMLSCCVIFLRFYVSSWLIGLLFHIFEFFYFAENLLKPFLRFILFRVYIHGTGRHWPGWLGICMHFSGYAHMIVYNDTRLQIREVWKLGSTRRRLCKY